MNKPDDNKDFIAAPPPNAQVVDEAPRPARARVSDADDSTAEESASAKLDRKRDYLEGFLQKKPEPVANGEPGGELYEDVISALKDIYDPEIPVNIYELGLIYNVDVSSEADVAVTMTLTTPHCPVAESMPAEIEMRIGAIPGVRDAEVVVTWDPPWDPSKMSDEARLELGML
jgi:FeS assembly SUF system protein